MDIRSEIKTKLKKERNENKNERKQGALINKGERKIKKEKNHDEIAHSIK